MNFLLFNKPVPVAGFAAKDNRRPKPGKPRKSHQFELEQHINFTREITLDYNRTLNEARENNPEILTMEQQLLEAERAVAEALSSLADRRRLIVSAGGGCPPGVPTENLEALCRAAGTV